MSLNNLATFNVDEKLVKEIASQALTAAVAKQLGDPEALISSLMGRLLTVKVDSEGNISSYSSENKYTFIEAETQKMLRECCRDVMKEWLAGKKDIIKKTLEKELDKPAHMKSIAKAIIDATGKALEFNSNFQCNVKMTRD
jgi:hypothetical protein